MESIKQEIINNIYENGENLITGPVLQGVLLDMVDDVNDKVASASVAQDIVEKTGSWDDAADWVEDNSGSLVHDVDLDDYATKQWVEDQGYLKEHQDISGLASTASVNELSESVANDFANLPEVDLSGYATTESVNEATESVKEWVEAKHYLTSASLSGSVTEETVGFMINDATASVKDWVESQSYATEQWVEEQGYLKEHQDISGLATTESVNQLSESIAQTIEDLPQVDLNGYVTTASYNVDSASFDERINNIPVVDPSEYVTTGSFEDLEGRVDILEEDVANLANAKDALEGAEIITWDDESEEYIAVPLATSESVGLLSQSISQSIVDSTDMVANKAEASLTSLSESIAEELETKVDDEGVYNILAGTGLAEAEYDEWIIYEAAKADDLRDVSSSLSASIAAITGSGTPQDLSGYLTTASYQVDSASFNQRIDAISPQDLSIYATTASVSGAIEALALNDDFDNPVFKALESSSIAFWDSDNGHWVISFQYDNPDDPVGQFLSSINAAQYDDGNGTWKLTPSFNVYDEYDPVGDFLSNMGIASYEGGMWTLTISSLEALDTLIQNGFIYQDPNLGTWMLDAPTRQEFEDVSASAYTVDENLTFLSESVDLLSASFDDRINNIPTGSGSGDCLWKSSDGSGSLVPSASNCVAPGAYAIAEGNHTTASGEYAHAEGNQTKASGYYSHAEGFGTTALNSYEHAQGRYNATASNQIFSVGVGRGGNFRRNAISIITGSSGASQVYIRDVGGYDGTNPTASVNDVATIISGLATTQSVNDLSSSVETFSASFDARINNIITGSGVDLSGYATTASLNSVSESLSASIAAITSSGGSGSSDGLWERGSGVGSLVPGERRPEDNPCEASGHDAVAIGGSTTASGQYSFAAGFGSRAEAYQAFAEGYWTRAWGYAAHAEGDHSRAMGHSSHAEGLYTSASGDYSHAEGRGTVASGETAHAEGDGTIAPHVSEHASGRYNTSSAGQIFSVGVGHGTASAERKNAFSIIRGTTPSASIYVYGVGSYVGNNPQPGVNDLATVVSSLGPANLENFLFGTDTQTITSITGSVTNIASTVSANATLGFNAVPDDGRSLGITIHNTGANKSVVTLPEAVTVEGTTYNLINNGVDGSGSMSIPAGEYGDIVVTRIGNDLFLRTSIDVSNIDIDLSEYATTASVLELSSSVGTLSASFDSRINNLPTSASVSALSASFDDRINSLPLSASVVTGSYTTETWTFVLEDSSSVSKKIMISLD